MTNIDTGAAFEQSTLPFGTAFGAESSGYSNQVFTSHDRSAATGLDYANNRTYSSGQGRFTQVDPIGMSAATIGNPQSNNMYAYVQNMPTDFVDPSGLLALFCTVWHQVYVGGPNDGQHVPGSYFLVCRLEDNGMAGAGSVPVSLPNGGATGSGGGSGPSSAEGERNRAENIMKCMIESTRKTMIDARESMETSRSNAFNSMAGTMVGSGVVLGAAGGVVAGSQLGPGAVATGALGALAGLAYSGIDMTVSWKNLTNDLRKELSQVNRSVGEAFTNCLKGANVN